MVVMYDYSKLLGRIKEKGFTLKEFAKIIGINPSTLSIKLSGKAYFTQKEIEKICQALDICGNEIGLYFFTPKV